MRSNFLVLWSILVLASSASARVKEKYCGTMIAARGNALLTKELNRIINLAVALEFPGKPSAKTAFMRQHSLDDLWERLVWRLFNDDKSEAAEKRRPWLLVQESDDLNPLRQAAIAEMQSLLPPLTRWQNTGIDPRLHALPPYGIGGAVHSSFADWSYSDYADLVSRNLKTWVEEASAKQQIPAQEIQEHFSATDFRNYLLREIWVRHHNFNTAMVSRRFGDIAKEWARADVADLVWREKVGKRTYHPVAMASPTAQTLPEKFAAAGLAQSPYRALILESFWSGLIAELEPSFRELLVEPDRDLARILAFKDIGFQLVDLHSEMNFELLKMRLDDQGPQNRARTRRIAHRVAESFLKRWNAAHSVKLPFRFIQGIGGPAEEYELEDILKLWRLVPHTLEVRTHFEKMGLTAEQLADPEMVNTTEGIDRAAILQFQELLRTRRRSEYFFRFVNNAESTAAWQIIVERLSQNGTPARLADVASTYRDWDEAVHLATLAGKPIESVDDVLSLLDPVLKAEAVTYVGRPGAGGYAAPNADSFWEWVAARIPRAVQELCPAYGVTAEDFWHYFGELQVITSVGNTVADWRAKQYVSFQNPREAKLLAQEGVRRLLAEMALARGHRLTLNHTSENPTLFNYQRAFVDRLEPADLERVLEVWPHIGVLNGQFELFKRRFIDKVPVTPHHDGTKVDSEFNRRTYAYSIFLEVVAVMRTSPHLQTHLNSENWGRVISDVREEMTRLATLYRLPYDSLKLATAMAELNRLAETGGARNESVPTPETWKSWSLLAARAAIAEVTAPLEAHNPYYLIRNDGAPHRYVPGHILLAPTLDGFSDQDWKDLLDELQPTIDNYTREFGLNREDFWKRYRGDDVRAQFIDEVNLWREKKYGDPLAIRMPLIVFRTAIHKLVGKLYREKLRTIGRLWETRLDQKLSSAVTLVSMLPRAELELLIATQTLSDPRERVPGQDLTKQRRDLFFAYYIDQAPAFAIRDVLGIEDGANLRTALRKQAVGILKLHEALMDPRERFQFIWPRERLSNPDHLVWVAFQRSLKQELAGRPGYEFAGAWKRFFEVYPPLHLSDLMMEELLASPIPANTTSWKRRETTNRWAAKLISSLLDHPEPSKVAQNVYRLGGIEPFTQGAQTDSPVIAEWAVQDWDRMLPGVVGTSATAAPVASALTDSAQPPAIPRAIDSVLASISDPSARVPFEEQIRRELAAQMARLIPIYGYDARIWGDKYKGIFAETFLDQTAHEILTGRDRDFGESREREEAVVIAELTIRRHMRMALRLDGRKFPEDWRNLWVDRQSDPQALIDCIPEAQFLDAMAAWQDTDIALEQVHAFVEHFLVHRPVRSLLQGEQAYKHVAIKAKHDENVRWAFSNFMEFWNEYRARYR
jgi:hypothetical protein